MQHKQDHSKFEKVEILLRNTDESLDHNKRILEYLDERYQHINNAGYAIAIEVVEDENINKFIKRNIVSIPALVSGDQIEYGVNSILATLARLEIKRQIMLDTPMNDEYSIAQSHHDMILKEMCSGEPDDDQTETSIRFKNQDISDSAMSDKDIESKMAKIEAIYSSRKKNNPQAMARKSAMAPVKSVETMQQRTEKSIQARGYSQGEDVLMRERARAFQQM